MKFAMFNIIRIIGLLTTAAAIQMDNIDPQAMHHEGYTQLTWAAVQGLNNESNVHLRNMLPRANPNFVCQPQRCTTAGMLTSWEAIHTGIGSSMPAMERLPGVMEILFEDPRMEFNTDVWNANDGGRTMLTHLFHLIVVFYQLPYTHDENGSTIPLAVSLRVLDKFAEANEKRRVQRKLEEFHEKDEVFTEDVTRIIADSMGVHGEIIKADKLPEKLELVSSIADERHASFITPRIQRDLILEELPPVPTAGPVTFPTSDMDLLTHQLQADGAVILFLNPSVRKLIPQEYHDQLFPRFDEATVQQARAFLQTIDDGRHCI